MFLLKNDPTYKQMTATASVYGNVMAESMGTNAGLARGANWVRSGTRGMHSNIKNVPH